VWFSVAIFLMGIIVALALEQLGGLIGGVYGIDNRHANYQINVQQSSYGRTDTFVVLLLAGLMLLGFSTHGVRHEQTCCPRQISPAHAGP
jgi:membrane protein required for beta-lactamase induction